MDDDPVAGTDEGWALMQIAYDFAPDAKLCFATAFTGEVQFAANILKLADPNSISSTGPSTSNRFVQLGLDFDNPHLGFGGINTSLLFGTKVTATIQSGNTTKTVGGMRSAPTGRGYSVNAAAVK